MTKSLPQRYREYILFEREDQRIGVDFLVQFIEMFRETRNTTILDDILRYHFGEDQANIRALLLFFTPTEIVDGRFRFYAKKKHVQRFDPPRTPPKGKIASYKMLRSIIDNEKYLSLLAQLDEMAQKREARERKAAEAHIERERRRLNPKSSAPTGKSITTVSGGLPTLGKRR